MDASEPPLFAADQLTEAVHVIRSGGIVAYPTEAVFGLGCDPFSKEAVERVMALKRRPPERGFLLIAADLAQLAGWVDWSKVPSEIRTEVEATWPGPSTWILPRHPRAPTHVVGTHEGIAVRVTAHTLAAALCRAFGAPLVSTSANRHGQPPARNVVEVLSQFAGDPLGGIVVGDVGGSGQPTPIRDALTGQTVRP